MDRNEREHFIEDAELTVDEQIELLNMIQGAHTAAVRHEPELAGDSYRVVNELATDISISRGETLHFNGKEWV